MVSRLLSVLRYGFRLVPASPISATRLRLRGERGATAVEYGVLVSMIAAAVIVAVMFLGDRSRGTFECTVDSITTASTQCP